MSFLPEIKSIQLTDSIVGQQVATSLLEYRRKRDEERKLRERIHFLEWQAAQQGPLHREVDLVLAIRDVSKSLDGTRQQLAEYEQMLARLEALPESQRVEFGVDEIESLLSEVKAHREQLRIHQNNLHYLEERQAEFGVSARLDIHNALCIERQELEKVVKELADLKLGLLKWNIDPDAIPNLESMAEQDVRDLVVNAVQEVLDARADEAAMRRREAEASLLAAAEPYDKMVVQILKELGHALYEPHGRAVTKRIEAEVPDNRPELGLLGVDLKPGRPAQLGEVVWTLSFVGSFGRVSIALPLDAKGEPGNFTCCVYRLGDGKLKGNATAERSRQALIDALKSLYVTKKSWWQVWCSSPAFPDSWT